MSFYYSKEDEAALESRHSEIMKNVKNAEFKLTPNAKERQVICETILKFAAERNRIIYGGYALHLLILEASKGKDRIYDPDDRPDVEFYTPQLKSDVRDICHLFQNNGHKYVYAEEGVHPNTFVVRVEMTNVLDITFTPAPFYESLPFVVIGGNRIITPEFAMIDVFRVYSFPLNNFFRLQKSFTRANLLLRYYPLKLSKDSSRKSNTDDDGHKVLEHMIKHGAISKSMIFTGQVAQNEYCHEAGIQPDPTELPLIAVSTSYAQDSQRLEKIFKGKPKRFLPFTELLNRKTLFYHKGQPVLVLIEEGENCVSYTQRPKFRITTTQGTAFYSFCLIFQARMQKRPKEMELHRRIIERLVMAKKAFFEKNLSLRVTDPTPFQEFVVKCSGEQLMPFRKFGLERTQRIKEHKPLKYRYTPSKNPNEEDRGNKTFMSMNTYVTVGQEE